MTPLQKEALHLKDVKGLSRKQVAERMGRSERSAKYLLERARAALKRESAQKQQSLDPEIMQRLASQGLTDLRGLHSGWLIDKNDEGSGSSLYFYLGPDQERIDFADAVRDVLSDIEPLAPISVPPLVGADCCNLLPLADLHCGGEYGNPEYEAKLIQLIDRIVSRLPPAEKAVVVELGDLLDANDHKGVTPASGNNCDVVRDDHFGQMKMAIRVMKHAIHRLAETHAEVEVHMMRGNHDETSFMGVLLALGAFFKDSPHVNIIETVDDYRVIEWGGCAVFPNHGDRAKWEALRDVWVADFPDEWAKAKVCRLIWTAHFHSLKSQVLAGVTCTGHRSTAKGNRYVHLNGWRSKRGICAVTLHKTEGEVDYTPSFIRAG